jgi:hypothetical protein
MHCLAWGLTEVGTSGAGGKEALLPVLRVDTHLAHSCGAGMALQSACQPLVTRTVTRHEAGHSSEAEGVQPVKPTV